MFEKYLFRIIFYLGILLQLVFSDSAGIRELTIILIIISSNIYRIKYNNTKWLITLEVVLLLYIAYYNKAFLILLVATIYDLIYFGRYSLTLIVGIISLILGGIEYSSWMLFAIGLSSLYGYSQKKRELNEKQLIEGYDNERKYRYQLEEARNKLLVSSREIAHLAEIKERNRIARDIHDNIGHNIAAILMQLQACKQIFDKDQLKAYKLLQSSIDSLTDSLTILRNTVHNLRPSQKIGINYIKELIDNFKFCAIDLNITGNTDRIESDIIEIFATNIKETLTNASKYSNANKIDISIDSNINYIRLCIKDNGIGCYRIKEGMGLSGIRERVEAIGGTVTFSGEDGFMMVCFIPVKN